MTPSERNSAIESLRRAATSALEAKREQRQLQKSPGPVGRLRKAMKKIAEVWADFPECRIDGTPVPTPEAVMEMIERFDREAAEQKRFEESLRR